MSSLINTVGEAIERLPTLKALLPHMRLGVDDQVRAIEIHSHLGAQCIDFLDAAEKLLFQTEDWITQRMIAVAVISQLDKWYFGEI